MWIKESGQISEVTYHIATAVSSHLLFASEKIALVDTGISATSSLLIGELDSLLGSDNILDYILITHSHFDHVGGIPYLRKYAPNIVVVGSPTTAELLENREFCEKLFERNVACAKAMNQEMVMEFDEWFSAMFIDRIVGDGDVIELGDGVDIKVIGCPGHAIDNIGYYAPSDGVLVAAEAIGAYTGRDKSYCCFRFDYEDYLHSLDKFCNLDIRALSLPHGGVLTGALAQKFVLGARQVAESFCGAVKERIVNGELIDEIVDSLLVEWRIESVCPDGPFELEQEGTLKDMVKLIAEL